MNIDSQPQICSIYGSNTSTPKLDALFCQTWAVQVSVAYYFSQCRRPDKRGEQESINYMSFDLNWKGNTKYQPIDA